MKKVVKTFYITEDGAKFESEGLALAHEDSLKIKHFDSTEEMVEFVKQTEAWKDWERGSMGLKQTCPVTLHDELRELGKILSKQYPKLYIGKSKNPTNIGFGLWSYYESQAMVDYFRAETDVVLDEDKVMEIYHLAYSNNHSYGVSGTVDEFDKYIDVIKIVLNKSDI